MKSFKRIILNIVIIVIVFAMCLPSVFAETTHVESDGHEDCCTNHDDEVTINSIPGVPAGTCTSCTYAVDWRSSEYAMYATCYFGHRLLIVNGYCISNSQHFNQRMACSVCGVLY